MNKSDFFTADAVKPHFTYDDYCESADMIASHLGDFRPEVLLVLGSGLGFLGDRVEARTCVSYADIPHFRASTAPGHEGRFVFGELRGKRVAVMQGRMHCYEGYTMEDAAYACRVIRLLGAKTMIVTNAAGAGGITGTIAFDVTAADESDLPDDGEKNYVGSVDQLDGSDIIATFAADDSGIANKESDVSVGFDTSKFEAPGVYYYHLTERDPGIHGLTATTATYLLKVRVVNDNTSDPDGTTFKIDYATLTSLDDNTKSDLITNTYTTHGLTVTKALAGDWADYTDHFIFTLEITDPDADPGRMASVTVQTTSAAGVTSDAEVKPFTNGKVSFSETIRGGDVIEVTGLPTGAAYTITESGLDAEKYTTAWTLDGETLSTERALPTQTVGAADTALTVTNTRSSIAPTGLLLDAAPYGAMLALAAGSGLVFFRKRRRED